MALRQNHRVATHQSAPSLAMWSSNLSVSSVIGNTVRSTENIRVVPTAKTSQAAAPARAVRYYKTWLRHKLEQSSTTRRMAAAQARAIQYHRHDLLSLIVCAATVGRLVSTYRLAQAVGRRHSPVNTAHLVTAHLLKTPGHIYYPYYFK